MSEIESSGQSDRIMTADMNGRILRLARDIGVMRTRECSKMLTVSGWYLNLHIQL
jgi:hypothetical protein